jgi:flavin-dependent dehydrogenase
MFTGEIAGKIASDAISKKDYSKAFLSKYEKEWKGKFKRRLKTMKKGRDIFEKCTDKDIDFLIESLEVIGLPDAEKKISESGKYDIPHILKYTLSNCKDTKALIKLFGWGLRKVL